MHTNNPDVVWDARLRQWVSPDAASRSEDMVWDGQKWVLPGTDSPAARTADGDQLARSGQRAEATEPAAAPDFDPGDHSVAEVKQYLTDNPDDAKRVMRLERKGKARTSLVDG